MNQDFGACAPTLRLLRICGDQAPLVIVDDGQDFDTLYTRWCEQDDAYCEGLISEKQWQDAAEFLRGHGVTVLEPAAVDDLGDFYA